MLTFHVNYLKIDQTLIERKKDQSEKLSIQEITLVFENFIPP